MTLSGRLLDSMSADAKDDRSGVRDGCARIRVQAVSIRFACACMCLLVFVSEYVCVIVCEYVCVIVCM